jgi:hypothetical protein
MTPEARKQLEEMADSESQDAVEIHNSDPEQAYRSFLAGAEAGWKLAIEEVGKRLAKGCGCEPGGGITDLEPGYTCEMHDLLGALAKEKSDEVGA